MTRRAPRPDDDPVLATAVDAAVRAGRLLVERWELPVSGRSSKSSSTDEVSDADRASEALIVDAIRRDHPDDEIVSEEGGGVRGRSGRRWLVDPLDGTINWLYGVPQWCVSVACADGRGPFVGVVHDPVRRELFVAVLGRGAWLRSSAPDATDGEPRALAVTAVTDLGLALLADGFSYDPEERREQARREAQIVPVVRDVRRFGSAALDLAWLAAGRLDAYSEAGAHEWDWAAGRLLVTEAGGRLSETVGVRRDGPTLVASGPGIHDALVALLRRAQGS